MGLADISVALNSGRSFSLSADQRSIVYDSLFEKIKRFFNPEYDKAKIAPLAGKLARLLNDEQRVSPREAAKHLESLKSARVFRRKFGSKNRELGEVALCQNQEAALSLGVPLSTLNLPINDGFFAYAKKTCLDCYLSKYRHSLIVDPSTEEISILSGGVYKKWGEVKQKALQDLQASEQAPQPKQPWFYDQTGLICSDMHAWATATPFNRIQNHKWKNRYVITIKVHALIPGIKDNHTWWHYKTPQGDKYSFSKYRPVGADTSCSLEKGRFQSPDISDYWRGYAHTDISFAISKEQFESLIALENAQKQTNPKFDNLNNNCTVEALKRLEHVGIFIPSIKRNAFRFVVSPKVAAVCDFIGRFLPQVIYDFALSIISFIGNIVVYNLGGSKIDPAFQDSCRPRYEKFSDLCDQSKLDFISPYYLVEDRFKEAFEWRKSEKIQRRALLALSINDHERARLQQEIEDLDYACPPSWRQ